MLFELARGRLEQVQVTAPVRACAWWPRTCRCSCRNARTCSTTARNKPCWGTIARTPACAPGDEAVQGLRFRPTTAPECAWQAATDSQPCPSLNKVRRPGWLLPQPTLLAEHGVQILMGPERIELAGGMAPMCAATITWSRPAPASRVGPIARWGKAMGCGCKGGLHEPGPSLL